MKFFRWLDSQVIMSVFTKHRRWSIRFNRVRKIDALELASGSFGVVGHVKSNVNPSDDHSRLEDSSTIMPRRIREVEDSAGRAATCARLGPLRRPYSAIRFQSLIEHSSIPSCH